MVFWIDLGRLWYLICVRVCSFKNSVRRGYGFLVKFIFMSTRRRSDANFFKRINRNLLSRFLGFKGGGLVEFTYLWDNSPNVRFPFVMVFCFVQMFFVGLLVARVVRTFIFCGYWSVN